MVNGIACTQRETPGLRQYLEFVLRPDENSHLSAKQMIGMLTPKCESASYKIIYSAAFAYCVPVCVQMYVWKSHSPSLSLAIITCM